MLLKRACIIGDPPNTFRGHRYTQVTLTWDLAQLILRNFKSKERYMVNCSAFLDTARLTHYTREKQNQYNRKDGVHGY